MQSYYTRRQSTYLCFNALFSNAKEAIQATEHNGS